MTYGCSEELPEEICQAEWATMTRIPPPILLPWSESFLQVLTECNLDKSTKAFLFFYF